MAENYVNPNAMYSDVEKKATDNVVGYVPCQMHAPNFQSPRKGRAICKRLVQCVGFLGLLLVAAASSKYLLQPRPMHALQSTPQHDLQAEVLKWRLVTYSGADCAGREYLYTDEKDLECKNTLIPIIYSARYYGFGWDMYLYNKTGCHEEGHRVGPGACHYLGTTSSISIKKRE